ncbi:hypothetical protein E3N88_34603 [Mikania micrantha]|uniref:VQ domain-containing protein n=1 Tax=Mikania micrantha TaxID=192012 RepID=A0A5N6M194_9ASTR|nr:hypothetical protein E3N88_34603 [Mikania micrantha]
MSRSRRAEPVKVVIINTEYVETDASSFKSVVQRLTGKDAPTATLHGGGGGGDGGRYCNGNGNSPILKKGLSFRDLDKLVLELPTIISGHADIETR